MSEEKTDVLEQTLAYEVSEPKSRSERRFDQRTMKIPNGESVTIQFRHLYDTYIVRNEGIYGKPLAVSVGSGPGEGNVPYSLMAGEWLRLPAVDHRLHIYAYFGTEEATIIAESGWPEIGFSSPNGSKRA